MLRVSVAICFISIIVLVVGFVTPQLATAQDTEWETYTNDKFKFSIDYPAHDVDTDFNTEAGDILFLTLGVDYGTDEEYMGITISAFSTNMSSLSEMVEKDLENLNQQNGPLTMFEGPMDKTVGDDKSCSAYSYSEYGETMIHRVVLCEHDDKQYRFDFKGKSILFYYEEEPYNHMIDSIRFSN